MPTKLDRLIDLKPTELALLREVKKLGAALKLDRLGDDLKPEIANLRKRKLLNIRTVDENGEKAEIYLTSHDIRDLL